MTKITNKHTNTTVEHQLVGNSKEVLFQGSHQDCLSLMNKIDVASSKWGLLQVVAPNETVEGTYVNHNFKQTDEDLTIGLFSK